MSGQPIQMGEVRYEELATLLEDYEIEFFVVEQFMVRTKNSKAGKNHRVAEFDKAVAARAIGKIEARAERLGVPVHFQQSSVLDGAAGMFGIKKRSHQKDVLSAVLHGLHYAHVHLGLAPKVKDWSSAEDDTPAQTVVVAMGDGMSFKQALKQAGRK